MTDSTWHRIATDYLEDMTDAGKRNQYALIVDQILSAAGKLEVPPQVVVLIGAPAVGKSRIRRQEYATGFVHIDAGDIFNAMGDATGVDFPGPREMPMQAIGRLVSHQAILERRNIVMELIGQEAGPITRMIDSLRRLGYQIAIRAITCEIGEAWRRNESRGINNVSAYYAEAYHRTWIIEACDAIMPK